MVLIVILRIWRLGNIVLLVYGIFNGLYINFFNIFKFKIDFLNSRKEIYEKNMEYF